MPIAAGGPVPTITAPATGSTFRVGDTLDYAGSAVDGLGNPLPVADLSWQLTVRHCSVPTVCHNHQLDAANGVAGGSVAAPEHELPSYVSIALTATDATGLSSTVTRDVYPEVAHLQLASAPAGLKLTANDETEVAPFTYDLTVGASTTVSAPSLQSIGGKLYRFSAWSDGGAATHTVTVNASRTLTATYTALDSTAVPPPTGAGWTLNGSTAVNGADLVLTQAHVNDAAGSAFPTAPVGAAALVADFDVSIGGGDGAGSDGLAFVMADPAAGSTALGAPGLALGYGGIPGVAVTADTYQNTGDPSRNFVGIATGITGDHLDYVATSTAVGDLRAGTHHMSVSVADDAITVTVDGAVVLANVPVGLPDQVLTGFSAGTGGFNDRQAVSNVSIVGSGGTTTTPPSTGTVPSPIGGGWTVNGTAAVAGSELVLNPAGETYAAGSAFYPTAVPSGAVTAAFDATLNPGSGADGLTFVLADPSEGAAALGGAGWRMGYGGIDGVAVAADTYKNSSDPSANFVGIATGDGGDNALTYTATSTAVSDLRTGTHHFVVTVADGKMSVVVDGVAVIAPTAVDLPPNVLVGFSAGTGSLADRHAVSNVVIDATSPPPAGTVTVPPPTAGGWTVNGSTAVAGPELVLTPPDINYNAGSAFYPTAVPSGSVSAAFDSTIGPGSGADGFTFVLADPSAGATALGGAGWRMGYGGIDGVAVTADTYQNSSDPSANFVGIATGDGGVNALTYVATSTNAPALRTGTHHFVVTVAAGKISVVVDGITVIAPVAVDLPPNVLVGFTAGTGGLADRHAVSNVAITAASGSTTTPPQSDVPPPTGGAWTLNGAAALAAPDLVLTPADTTYNAGSAFYPTAVASTALTVAYDTKIGPGSGADGLTFVLADPSAGATALGGAGWRMGYGGIPGIAVTADTYKNSSDPSANFVGIATGDGEVNALTYLATSTSAPNLRSGVHHFVITIAAGTIAVAVDGSTVIAPTAVTLPPQVLLGFTAGTGGGADRHSVKNVVINTGAAPAAAPVAFRTDVSTPEATSFALADVTPVTFCTLPRHDSSRV